MNTRAYFLSTKVVIRDGRGQVLVLQRAANSKNHARLWEFPGGKTDPGESFDQALLREVNEETGLEIVLEHVVGAGSSELAGKTIAYLFMEARFVAGEVRLSEEHEAFRWVTLAQLLQVELCPQFQKFAENYCHTHGYSRVAVQAAAAAKPAGGAQLDQWVEDYRAIKPRYDELARRSRELLHAQLDKQFVGIMVDSRAKTIASFAEKIVRKRKYTDPLRQITDLCGARIITQIKSEMDAVCAYIREHFSIDEANSLDARSRLGDTEFGYRSVHFVVQFRQGEFPGFPAELLPLKMEIQVRTTVEHAWADVAHDRLYKSGFKVPGFWHRESARVAAALESANDAFQRIVTGLEEYRSHFGAYLSQEQIQQEMEVCEAVLRHEPANARQASRRARLALSVDDWDSVEQTARDFPGEQPAELLLCHGTALCLRHQAGPQHPDHACGRDLLREAAKISSDDAEPHLRLADTTEDAAEKLFHLAAAFAIAPGDPEVLSAYVLQKIATERSVAFLPLLRPSILAAMKRCEQHVEAEVNLPLAHYQTAFFHLLLGDGSGTATDALERCVLAVRHTHAVSFLDAALRATHGLRACFHPPHRDVECVHRFLIVAHRALFPGHPLPVEISAPPARALPDAARQCVVILAGGCSKEVESRLEGFRRLLDEGLRDFHGAILCGGTREGVSGLAGGLFGKPSGRIVQVIGYVPHIMPTDGSATPDERCHELRHTDDKDSFSILEPLQAWLDILATGIIPQQVRLLGMNGGRIAGLEYRIAWALGASVGILQDSGREADCLQQNIRAGDFPGMLLLPQDAMSLRAFVRTPAPNALLLATDVRERLARLVHSQFLNDNRYRNPDPAMLPWEILRGDLQQSNLDQVEYMAQILAVGGFTIVPATGDFTDPGFTAAEVEHMAEMEHGRWNVERLRQNWHCHPERDPGKKQSPYLVAWKQLPDSVRCWDRDNIHAFPKRLAEIGLKVARA